MWLTNFPYVFAITASLEGQILLPFKSRTSLGSREGASRKEWLTKNPLGCTHAWSTWAGVNSAIVGLQGGALLTPSFGKQNKLYWQTENKVRVRCGFAEKGALYPCRAKHMGAKPESWRQYHDAGLPQPWPWPGENACFWSAYKNVCVRRGGRRQFYIAVLSILQF